MNKKFILFILSVLLAGAVPAVPLHAQQAGVNTIPIPTVNFNIQEARTPRQVALSLQILLLITVITLAPTLLIVLTSFVRIFIVLSFVSRGLATQNIPPNQVVVALALFLSLFIMFPVFTKSYKEGVQPYLDGRISLDKGFEKAVEPIREFMFRQTQERYIYRFTQMAKVERPRTRADVPTYVLIPAFILNELTQAFFMGLVILIPFTVIDVVVASVLMSVGMMMLPPIMISFPLKIVLFLLIDGWDLLVEKLILSFRM